MNRAQRRAERFTKRGRLDQAERERYVCEHGNPKKTDGNGNPMCPHGCGFDLPAIQVDQTDVHIESED